MSAIDLILITPQLAEALSSPATCAQQWRVVLDGVIEQVREVVQAHEVFSQRTGAPPQWGGYLACDTGSRQVIGTCAFKGAPDAAGCVEIAYFTFPAFEGRGYGGAMAGALVDKARASGLVRMVAAHTLPAASASTRILQRLGFTQVGTVIDDPADGPVWRWELAAAALPGRAAGH